MPSIKVCKHCKKIFIADKESRKYCSTECHDTSMKQTTGIPLFSCPQCHQDFRPGKSSWRKYKKGKTKILFCSKVCSDKYRSNKVTLVCKNCGEEFSVPKSQERKTFCSRECHNNYSTKELYSCDYCGEEFLVDQYQLRRLHDGELHHLYCSKDCSHEGQKKKIDVVCEICEATYQVIPCLESSTHYCSTACRIEAMRIRKKKEKEALLLMRKTDEYGERKITPFIRQRMRDDFDKLREKYDNTCVITGRKGDVVIHHVLSLNLIIKEALCEFNLNEYPYVCNYTEDGLRSILKYVLTRQQDHGLLVCIDQEVHSQFHNLYGYGDNTPEQWDEFIKEYYPEAISQEIA